MCLFCDNYGHCITGIEKNRVDVLCAVGELSAKEKQVVYFKSSEFSREAGGISGPSKADGWCLCFGPGPFPVAHPGRGTVQGPEPRL